MPYIHLAVGGMGALEDERFVAHAPDSSMAKPLLFDAARRFLDTAELQAGAAVPWSEAALAVAKRGGLMRVTVNTLSASPAALVRGTQDLAAGSVVATDDETVDALARVLHAHVCEALGAHGQHDPAGHAGVEGETRLLCRECSTDMIPWERLDAVTRRERKEAVLRMLGHLAEKGLLP